MPKMMWVAKAKAKLNKYLGDYSGEYAASLYTTYVEEDPDKLYADDPDSAVDEDMSYWG